MSGGELEFLRREVERVFKTPLASDAQRDALRAVFSRTQAIPLAPAVEILISVALPDLDSIDCAVLYSLAREADRSMQHNAFHSPQHAFLVAMVAVLLAQNQAELRCAPRGVPLVAISALGHDLDHPGSSAGEYGLFDIERRSAALTTNIMRKHGLPQSECDFVSLIILSSFSSVRRPLIRLMDGLELGAPLTAEDCQLPTALPSGFSENRLGVLAAAALSDADLFYSIAIDAPMTLELSRRLLIEARSPEVESALPDLTTSFIGDVSGRNFATEAGARFLNRFRSIADEVGCCELGQRSELESEEYGAGRRRAHTSTGGPIIIGRSGLRFIKTGCGGFRLMSAREQE